MEEKLYDPKIKSPRPPQELPEALTTVFALGALNRLDDTLADPKFITRTGTDLALAVPMPKELIAVSGGVAALGVGALLPAIQKIREAAARMQSNNNLKQIGLAIHAYHDVWGSFPTDRLDKNGKPILSWRVEILPFIEQENLYKQFKLDEPWDSAHNKVPSQTLVKTFMAPNATPPAKYEWGYTSYRGISGPGTAFEAGKKLKFVDFTDGTSNTIVVIETDEWVPWAKPGDFALDPDKPLPKIVPVGQANAFLALFADGSVRAISTSIAAKALRAAFTRNGGEIFDLDEPGASPKEAPPVPKKGFVPKPPPSSK
jgi:hypothetical protein